MRKNNGVTLIALVITIIVLLILAGVALSMIMGDSGIFGKANTANQRTKESQALEDVRLLILEAQTEAASQNKSATLADVMDQIEKSSNTYLVKTTSSATSRFSSDVECIKTLPEGTTEIYVTNIEYGCEVKVNSNLKAELTNVTVEVSHEQPKEPEQYTISYDLNGGTGTIEDQIKIEDIPLEIAKNKPTKEGYVFMGWSVVRDGTVEYTSGENYTENANVTLYAKWDTIINSTGYVTNNLLSMYDGIYNTNQGTDPNSQIWYDLKGSNNISLSGAKQYNNYIKFDGVDDSASTNSVVNFNNSKSATFEFVDINNSISSGIGMIFELSSDWNSNNAGFGVSANEYNEYSYALTFCKKDTGYNIKTTAANVINSGNINTYTFVVNTANSYNNYIKIYKNGVLLNTTAPGTLNCNISNTSLVNYKLYLCSRAGNKTFSKLNIGCLRIYNSELTQEEITNNYNIDQSRFLN